MRQALDVRVGEETEVETDVREMKLRAGPAVEFGNFLLGQVIALAGRSGEKPASLGAILSNPAAGEVHHP